MTKQSEQKRTQQEPRPRAGSSRTRQARANQSSRGSRPSGNRRGGQGNQGRRPSGGRGAPSRGDSRPRESADERRSAPAATTPSEKAPTAAPSRVIEVAASISVRDLAGLMGLSLIDVIKHLMNEGIMANINQQLDRDIAVMVAEDMGFQVKEPAKAEPEKEEAKPAAPAAKRTYTDEERKRLASRPPVVTIMGHVDHGKTKLLDAIRQTNVAGGEAGGITQRIGAYQVEKQGRRITFLDTPGHEAFTAMRARGAKVTDIAVLVVAADDGVMPQTLEAINHARAAQVPIVVAINKIDKDNANPDFVKQQLSDAGLVVEDWGGEVISVEVSARNQVGIDSLLDMILLVADLAELKALDDVPAHGTVIEATVDPSRGPVATLLVDEGTLQVGDSLVIGGMAGKVRAMFNDRMQRIRTAPPSTPVLVLGLSDTPEPGTTFQVVADDKTARVMAAEHVAAQEQETVSRPKSLTLDEIYAQIQAGAAKELVLVIKTKIQGSIEPIVTSLDKLSTDEVKVTIIHTGTGNVSESDIMLAAASKAVVIGFDVTVVPAAAKMAEAEGVSIRLYDIIYQLIDDVDKALKGMLEPEEKEVIIGHARVAATFRIPKVGAIAGAQIIDGKAIRDAFVRVLRGGQQIHEGKVASLRRFTEDVREVAAGFECGIGVQNFEKFQEGDTLEFYTTEQVSRAE